MDESTYIREIKKNMDRLILENAMQIVESANDSGNRIFKIQFHPPEWYTELDNDMQYNVQNNLANHYKEQVKIMIDDFNKEKDFRLKVKDIVE